MIFEPITIVQGNESSFAVPLRVLSEPGANIAAVLGSNQITGIANEDGLCTLVLPEAGVWSVNAQIDGDWRTPKEVEVANGYDLSISKESRLPEGYTELQYITNLPDSSGLYPYFTSAFTTAVLKQLTQSNRKIEMVLMVPERPATRGYLAGIAQYARYATNSSTGAKASSLCRTLAIIPAGYSTTFPNDTIAMCIGMSYPTTVTMSAAYSVQFHVGEVFTLTLDTVDSTMTVESDAGTYTGKYYKSDTNTYTGISLFGSNTKSCTTTSTSVCSVSGTPAPMNGQVRLYALRVYDRSTDVEILLEEYVPAISPDGEIGLYRLLQGDFLSSGSATAKFTAGPEV